LSDKSDKSATFAIGSIYQALYATIPDACVLAQLVDDYPLKYSFILDSALTVHIMNDCSRFIDFEESDGSKFIFAGDTRVLIEGTGTIIVKG
jgi:hypothetical protein